MTPWIILGIGMVASPLVLPWTMASEILIYSVVAVAANLLLGYAGLFSFGQASFFGLGGYAGGYLLAHYKVSLPVALAAGGIAGGIGAAIIGAICVRRTGIYFIMLTFAFNQMFYYLAYQLKEITGGEDGMTGIVRPSLDILGFISINISKPIGFYVLVSLVFLVCFIFMWRVIESPFGKIMVSTRENPQRAASIGYNVKNAQILMFAITGVVSGIAGVLYSMLYWIMPIDAIHWLNSGFIVFMVLIGGTNSPFGPVVGTTIFICLQDLFGIIWERWPLLFGVVVVCVVMFLQGGVLELVTRIRHVMRGRREASVQLGSSS
jgi:branched-chain amino acid transport system permease protein